LALLPLFLFWKQPNVLSLLFNIVVGILADMIMLYVRPAQHTKLEGPNRSI